MAETPSGAVSTNPTAGVTGAPSGGVTADDGKGDASEEIRKQKKRAQEAERERDELRRAQQEREQAEAVARGEHEKVIAGLNAELAALRPEVETYRAAIAARREALLAGLPEEHRPIATDLPLDKLEAYVGLHGKTATPPPPPPGVPGTATATGALTPQQILEGVLREGISFLQKIGVG